MRETALPLRFSQNQESEKKIHQIFRLLYVVARPPAGGYSEQTEWLRRSHRGPLLSLNDIRAITGASLNEANLALNALDNSGFLETETKPEGAAYALKRYYANLFLDIEAHGWSRWGETLRKAIAAGDKYASTTQNWGHWELHNDGYIITKEYENSFDEQFSTSTGKGREALKVLEIFFPPDASAAKAA
jgi:hypothetical protein